jgi:TetR/AcrR family transcriptional regulator, repressor for uid operon
MPKVLPEYKAQARQRITHAARAVFARRGFRAATMDDIAREVGVSKGALYLYFPTKIHLLREIQTQGRAEVFEKVQPLLTTGDIATGFVRAMEDMVAEHDSAIWHDLLVEAGRDSQLRAELDADRRNDLAALRQFLQLLVARRRLPAGTVVSAAAPILATLLEGGAVRLMLGEKPALVRRQLVRSIRYTLAARQPARRRPPDPRRRPAPRGSSARRGRPSPKGQEHEPSRRSPSLAGP